MTFPATSTLLRRGALLAAAPLAVAAATLVPAAPAQAGACIRMTVASDVVIPIDPNQTFVTGTTWCSGSPPQSVGRTPAVSVTFAYEAVFEMQAMYRAPDGWVAVSSTGSAGQEPVFGCAYTGAYSCSVDDAQVTITRASRDREAPRVTLGVPGAPVEAAALAGGLPVRVRSSEAGIVRATLLSPAGSAIHGRATATLRRGGEARTLRLRLTGAGRAAISPVGGSRHRLEVRVTDRRGNARTVRRTLVVR